MATVRARLVAASAALGTLVLVGIAGVTVIGTPAVAAVDGAWAAFVVRARPTFDGAALVFDALGRGVVPYVIAGAVALVLLVLRRPWSALAVVAAVATTNAVTPWLKVIVQRARPEDGEVLYHSFSYPSGHASNAAALAVALAIVVPRAGVRIIAALVAVAMMLSRTYLGVHWATDVVAGAIVGAAVGVLVASALAPNIRLERERRRPLAS